MEIFNIVIFVIILLGIIGIIYVTKYNKLQYLKTKIEQSENIADESLRNKFDLISKADIIIKKELKSKKDYLKNIIELKDQKISNFDLDRKLVEAMNIINTLISDNEKLENNHELQDILYEIKNNDEKLSAAKIYYNKTTTETNEIIRKFPSVVVAKIHKFKTKPYFDGKNMEDEIIDDFKL